LFPFPFCYFFPRRALGLELGTWACARHLGLSLALGLAGATAVPRHHYIYRPTSPYIRCPTASQIRLAPLWRPSRGPSTVNAHTFIPPLKNLQCLFPFHFHYISAHYNRSFNYLYIICRISNRATKIGIPRLGGSSDGLLLGPLLGPELVRAKLH
jgi:hypothetical protein